MRLILMRNLWLFLPLSIPFFITGCMQKPSPTSKPTTQQEITQAPQEESIILIEDDFVAQELKIAMILPHKTIGRYAQSTSTAVFSYLLSRQDPFVFKTFTVTDESKESMQTALKKIEDEGFNFLIAPVTLKGAKALVETESQLQIYLPTIHHHDIDSNSSNIYYGAIDYQAQIDAVMPLSSFPLVIMYDKSPKGEKLMEMSKESYIKTQLTPQSQKYKKIYTYAVAKKRSSLQNIFEDNEEIQNGSFFLNTPFIKSTMILSQLSLYDITTDNVLSTQINYDPLLFSMTQVRDRKHLYIANSITHRDEALLQANAILSNDINHDWINYSTTVGADLFHHLMTGHARSYNLNIQEQQVHYPIEILKATQSRFEKVN